MTLYLSYGPSKWNPADAISCVFAWGAFRRAVVEAVATAKALSMLRFIPTSFLGHTR